MSQSRRTIAASIELIRRDLWNGPAVLQTAGYRFESNRRLYRPRGPFGFAGYGHVLPVNISLTNASTSF